MAEHADGVLRVVVDDWADRDSGSWFTPLPLLPDTPDLSGYVAGLPGDSGEFTGTLDSGSVVAGALTDERIRRIPVEIDTGDQPNPAAVVALGAVLTFVVGNESWRLPVVSVELLGGNRVRAWCRKPEKIPE